MPTPNLPKEFNDRYILKRKVAVECPDLMEWAKWFEKGNRRIALTKIGNIRISTVFLGLDHSFGMNGLYQSITGSPVPVLFETMVFGGAHDQEMERYTTWEEAERGHNAMVQKVKTRNKITKKKNKKRMVLHHTAMWTPNDASQASRL